MLKIICHRCDALRLLHRSLTPSPFNISGHTKPLAYPSLLSLLEWKTWRKMRPLVCRGSMVAAGDSTLLHTRTRMHFHMPTQPPVIHPSTIANQMIRAVSGTPSFFINGISVDADPNWTLADWQQVLHLRRLHRVSCSPQLSPGHRSFACAQCSRESNPLLRQLQQCRLSVVCLSANFLESLRVPKCQHISTNCFHNRWSMLPPLMRRSMLLLHVASSC
jgi:hypothetical protein